MITPIAMEKELRFAIREGGRTVGAGVISEILRVRRGAVRIIVTLACSECKRRNYTTTKNKRSTPDKLNFKKYCRFCRTHTLHKETK